MPQRFITSDSFLGDEKQSVSVRFTNAEHAQIKLAADRRRMSFNTFVRKFTFLAAEKVLLAPDLDDELRRFV